MEVFERRTGSYRDLPSNVKVVFEFDHDYWYYYMGDFGDNRLFWIDNSITDDSVFPKDFDIENSVRSMSGSSGLYY